MHKYLLIVFCWTFIFTQAAHAQKKPAPVRKPATASPKPAATKTKPAGQPARPAAITKPAPAKTDTLINNPDPVSSDTLNVTSDTLTEQQAEELADKNAKMSGDTMHSYRIIVEDISYLSVCPGTTIDIPFRTIGPFDEDNTFIAQMIDGTGKSVPISLPVKKSPVKAVIPSYKIGGEVYKIQIVSTIPVIKSQEVPLRLLQTPAARIEVIDGTQSVRIMPGQEAQLKVSFTGTAPWSFRLSDSTNVMHTLSNPHYLTVTPRDVKAYKLLGVSNACGSGTASGEAIVNVNNNPEPKIELKEAEKIARLCAGVPFQVPFNATGKYKEGNRFTVQIAERTGAFKNISTPDSTGYITTQIPASYKPGEYKLRVVSSAPYLVTETANISILSPTTAILQKDSLRLGENESGSLTVRFTGGGPWFVLLSDGTYENNIIESPAKIKVKPIYDTNYQITSAGGLCGVGTFSGTAKVSVKSPPASITLEKLTQNIVCSGATMDLPYKTEGRYNPGNKFTVQMTDKSGRFVDVPAKVTPTSIQVKVIGTPGDTLTMRKVRVISSSPAVSSAIQELGVIAPDQAVAEVSGRGAISPGRSTRIQLKFKNGLPPWSFTLSDGTAINGTFLNPYLISVSPEKTTEYTISSLKSGCGTGAGRGSAMVTVDSN